jgi:colanic acid biosynthesis glycosyl transferase WcaI
MNELASYFAQKGHGVSVVTTLPRQQSEIEYKNRLYLEERKDGFLVKRFWANQSPSPIGRLIAWTLYTFWTILCVLKVRREDKLFLRLPPLQLGFAGILAKKLKGAKFILNVQDIHPDLAIESGILKNPIVIKWAKALEKRKGCP